MDIEARLIYSLLTCKKAEQDKFYMRMLPLGIFKTRELEFLWLRNFRQKHGDYPTLSLMQRQFSEKYPKHTDPLPAVLQPILDFAMFEQMRQVQSRVKTMLDNNEPVADAMAVFKQSASALGGFNTDYTDIDFSKSEGAIGRYREVVRQINNPNSRLVDFPWPTMNRMVRFLRWGNVVVFASRTSMGKTWIVTDWCSYLVNKGVNCVFITKEMPGEEIEDRFEALRFKLPYEQFRAGTLKAADLRRWRTDRKSFSAKGQLHICGDETIAGTGLDHVVQKIEQYKPEITFIDGAYLLRPEGLGKNANKVEQLTHLSNRMKVIAKATKTIVVPVLQLNRGAEDKSGNTKGSIVSIHNADAWAQDADYVITLGGKRGATSRIVGLVKGRESNVGEFPVEFKVNPFPSFRENAALGGTNTGTVQFKGVA